MGHAGFDIGRLNFRNQTHGETRTKPLLQTRDQMRRAVGGQYDLFAGLVQRIKGVKKLLLGVLFAFDKLNVIHQ
jgi:hypothetical protein